jgi:hypothetical protein
MEQECRSSLASSYDAAGGGAVHPVDHLARKRLEHGDHDGPVGSNHVVEEDGTTGILNDVETANVHQEDQILTGTGERVPECKSADTMYACDVVRHLEEDPGPTG